MRKGAGPIAAEGSRKQTVSRCNEFQNRAPPRALAVVRWEWVEIENPTSLKSHENHYV